MILTGSVWCQCFPSGIPLWPQWCTELTPCFYFILFSCDKSTTVDWWSWKCTFSFLFILVLLNQCLFNSCYSLCAFCLASQLNKAKWRTCGAEVKMELGCMLVMMGEFSLMGETVEDFHQSNNGRQPPKMMSPSIKIFHCGQFDGHHPTCVTSDAPAQSGLCIKTVSSIQNHTVRPVSVN